MLTAVACLAYAAVGPPAPAKAYDPHPDLYNYVIDDRNPADLSNPVGSTDPKIILRAQRPSASSGGNVAYFPDQFFVISDTKDFNVGIRGGQAGSPDPPYIEVYQLFDSSEGASGDAADAPDGSAKLLMYRNLPGNTAGYQPYTQADFNRNGSEIEDRPYSDTGRNPSFGRYNGKYVFLVKTIHELDQNMGFARDIKGDILVDADPDEQRSCPGTKFIKCKEVVKKAKDTGISRGQSLTRYHYTIRSLKQITSAPADLAFSIEWNKANESIDYENFYGGSSYRGLRFVNSNDPNCRAPHADIVNADWDNSENYRRFYPPERGDGSRTDVASQPDEAIYATLRNIQTNAVINYGTKPGDPGYDTDNAFSKISANWQDGLWNIPSTSIFGQNAGSQDKAELIVRGWNSSNLLHLGGAEFTWGSLPACQAPPQQLASSHVYTPRDFFSGYAYNTQALFNDPSLPFFANEWQPNGMRFSTLYQGINTGQSGRRDVKYVTYVDSVPLNSSYSHQVRPGDPDRIGEQVGNGWITTMGSGAGSFYNSVIRAFNFAPENGRTVPLRRFWNGGLSDHMYTSNQSLSNGWFALFGYQAESNQGHVSTQAVAGSVQLCEYYSYAQTDSFYTVECTDNNISALKAWGYHYRGATGWVMPTQVPGTIPLYRYWNASGDHFYTTNFGEIGFGAGGWNFERIEAYVWASPQTNLPPNRYHSVMSCAITDWQNHHPAYPLNPWDKSTNGYMGTDMSRVRGFEGSQASTDGYQSDPAFLWGCHTRYYLANSGPDSATNTNPPNGTQYNYNCTAALTATATDPQDDAIQAAFRISINGGASRDTSYSARFSSGGTATSDSVVIDGRSLTQFIRDLPGGTTVTWQILTRDADKASDVDPWMNGFSTKYSHDIGGAENTQPMPGGPTYKDGVASAPTTFTKRTPGDLASDQNTKRFIDAENGSVITAMVDGQGFYVETTIKNNGQTPVRDFTAIDYLGAIKDFEQPAANQTTVRYNDAGGVLRSTVKANIPTGPYIVNDRNNPGSDIATVSNSTNRLATWKLDFGNNQSGPIRDALVQATGSNELAPGASITLRYLTRADRNRTITSHPDEANADYQHRLTPADDHLWISWEQNYCAPPSQPRGVAQDFNPGTVLAPTFRGGRGSIHSNQGINAYGASGENATFVITANGSIISAVKSGINQKFDSYSNPTSTCSSGGGSAAEQPGGIDWRRKMIENVTQLKQGAMFSNGDTNSNWQGGNGGNIALNQGGRNVWRSTGNLTIGANGVAKTISGVGTLLVEGDLTINSNLTYQDQSQLHSLGIIVLGNLRINPNVARVDANIFVLDGNATMRADNPSCPFIDPSRGNIYTGATNAKLEVNGLLVGRYFNFQRYYADVTNNASADYYLDPAENVYYDGRVVANTPPGFGTFRNTAAWYEVAP